jgi:hypothetical protein
MNLPCTHVCKWKNDICWNYSRNWEGGWRKMVEGMNSSTIYLLYCKNFCKCHNVPPPSNKKKERKKISFNKGQIRCCTPEIPTTQKSEIGWSWFEASWVKVQGAGFWVMCWSCSPTLWVNSGKTGGWVVVVAHQRLQCEIPRDDEV